MYYDFNEAYREKGYRKKLKFLNVYRFFYTTDAQISCK